jgi:hypothetical protein
MSVAPRLRSYLRRSKRTVNFLIDMASHDNGTKFESASEIGQLNHCCVDARCDAPCVRCLSCSGLNTTCPVRFEVCGDSLAYRERGESARLATTLDASPQWSHICAFRQVVEIITPTA